MKTSNIIKLAGAVLVMCSASALASEATTTTTTTTSTMTPPPPAPTPAEPPSRFYLHADVGPAFMHDLALKGDGHAPMNTGARGDIAFGFNCCPDFAAELEAGAIWNRLKGSDFDVYQMPLLVNGIWKMPTHSTVTPYIGLGCGGVATHIVVGNLGSDTDYTFGYQGMVGVRYAMCPSTELDLSYKFFGSLDHEWTVNGSTAKFEGFMTHAVLISFVWKF